MGQEQSIERQTDIEEITIFEDDKHIIKKPEKLNYRVYDKRKNRCATFELKEDSLYINTIRYLSCELICELEMRLLHDICEKFARHNNRNKLEITDSSFMYIYFGIPSRREYYNLKYIYLYSEPSKPSYYMNTFNYVYEHNDSPIYKYMIKELERVISEYKKKNQYELLLNCKNLQYYSRYCYLYDQKKEPKNVVSKERAIYNDYILKIENISTEFKKSYRLFKEYIDYYTETIFKKYIITSTSLYKDDIYYNKLLNRANKYEFRLSSILNDNFFYTIKE